MTTKTPIKPNGNLQQIHLLLFHSNHVNINDSDKEDEQSFLGPKSQFQNSTLVRLR